MAPQSPRSPRPLRSPPPTNGTLTSPPRKTSHTRGTPSITPRRFRRFFTPRTRVPTKPSASRRILHDLGGPALNRAQTPSSPLKPVDNAPAFESTEPFLPPPKRRRISDAPISSSPPTSPFLKPLSLPPRAVETPEWKTALLSPLRGFPSADVDPESEDDEEMDLPPLPVNTKPVKSYANRYDSHPIQRLQRELGHVPRAASGRVRKPVLDWQNETADFCSLAEDSHTNISHDGNGNCIPFCAASCNTNGLVAVGDEEGRVRILDTNEPKENGGFDKIHIHFRAHRNAIIDLEFSQDDSLLATASGDQTGRVVDMATQTPVTLLQHHVASLKQIRWQPGKGGNSVLATSSRDGSIQIWDLRCRGSGPVEDFPADRRTTLSYESRKISTGCVVNSIFGAHARLYRNHTILNPVQGAGDSPGRGESAPIGVRLGDVSVTALQFLPPGKEHLLLSGCEADASLKLWDLRNVHKSKHKTSALPLSYTAQPDTHLQWRPFGISSIALGSNGTRVYALCKDNTVYAYSTAHLMLGYAPELSSNAHRRRQVQPEESLGPLYGFRHQECQVGSFYVKCAVRPAQDGRPEILAVGSSRGSPILFPTDERYLRDKWERDVYRERFRDPSDTASASRPTTYSTSFPQRPFRTSSISRDVAARPKDTIPISTNGTLLVRGHSSEVGSISWTRDGKLITVGDDYIVRAWRESPAQSHHLRHCGDWGPERWNAGWPMITSKWDYGY